jgi:hypothetical protein
MPGRNVEHDQQVDERDVARLHNPIDQRYDQRSHSDSNEGFDISLSVTPQMAAQGIRPKRLQE